MDPSALQAHKSHLEEQQLWTEPLPNFSPMTTPLLSPRKVWPTQAPCWQFRPQKWDLKRVSWEKSQLSWAILFSLHFFIPCCPDFGWIELIFFLVAVVWIWHEINVESTLIFWVLLSRAYPESRTFHSAREELHNNLGGAWPGQVTWSGQRDIPHLGMPGPVYKLGELAGSHWSVLGDGCWATVWASLLCLGFIPPSLSRLYYY